MYSLMNKLCRERCQESREKARRSKGLVAKTDGVFLFATQKEHLKGGQEQLGVPRRPVRGLFTSGRVFCLEEREVEGKRRLEGHSPEGNAVGDLAEMRK